VLRDALEGPWLPRAIRNLGQPIPGKERIGGSELGVKECMLVTLESVKGYILSKNGFLKIP
jgi:hypothetical protein